MSYYGKPTSMSLGLDGIFFSNKNPVLCPIKTCSIIADSKNTTGNVQAKNIGSPPFAKYMVYSNQQNIMGYKNYNFTL